MNPFQSRKSDSRKNWGALVRLDDGSTGRHELHWYESHGHGIGKVRMDGGMTYADIEVENLFTKRSMGVKALVDSGAVFLIIPEHVAMQLGFELTEVSTREVILPDGHYVSAPMIRPLRVRFADRYCDLSALVLGDEPLLGAVPMEMMDLVLHPATQSLSVNPASPYVPVALAK